MAGVPVNGVTAYLVQLRYWLTGLILASVLATGGLLLVRAAEGRIGATLGLGEAIAATLGLVLAANLARAAWDTRQVLARWLLPAAVILFLVALISWQTSSPDVRTAIWSITVTAELLAGLWILRPVSSTESAPVLSQAKHQSVDAHEPVSRPAATSRRAEIMLGTAELDPTDETTGEIETGEDQIDESLVTQQMTRSMTADGGETIAGRVRVDFRANEKQSAAHLAFMPPLRNIPEVYVDQSSGPAASVTPGSVYAHGVRVDVRLEEAATEPNSIWFEIYVVAPSREHQD
jgi:hypothetical protein